jgi:hypothetical protein
MLCKSSSSASASKSFVHEPITSSSARSVRDAIAGRCEPAVFGPTPFRGSTERAPHIVGRRGQRDPSIGTDARIDSVGAYSGRAFAHARLDSSVHRVIEHRWTKHLAPCAACDSMAVNNAATVNLGAT